MVLALPAQLAVRVEGIGEVARGVRRGVDDGLHNFRRPLLADRVRDDSARLPFDEGDDIRGLFLAPTKVNNSSTSSVPAVLNLPLGAAAVGTLMHVKAYTIISADLGNPAAAKLLTSPPACAYCSVV